MRLDFSKLNEALTMNEREMARLRQENAGLRSQLEQTRCELQAAIESIADRLIADAQPK